MKIMGNSNFSNCEYIFIGTLPCSFIYAFSMAWFHDSLAELSSCNTDHVACEAENIYYLPFAENVYKSQCWRHRRKHLPWLGRTCSFFGLFKFLLPANNQKYESNRNKQYEVLKTALKC